MKLFTTVALLFISLFCIAQKPFVLDENATVREISGSFNAIQVSSAIHLVLTKGETESIVVSAANEAAKANIITEIEDGTLKIYFKGNNYKTSYTKQLNVYVSYKALQSLRASDACNVLFADKLTASSFSVKVSDASILKGEINVDSLELKVSDASIVKLTGVSKNAVVRCSDASQISAPDLEMENAEIKANDASVIKVNVTKSVYLTANDASVITFKGAAEVKQRITRDASVIKHLE
jgi:hypothetical protein